VKAVRVLEPGGPEQLALADAPTPEPGVGEIAIDVHATALNRADLLQRRGLYPPPPGVTDILGLECAGTVAALGPGCVGTHALGARVMALLSGGGYAERVVIPEAMALAIPKAYGFEEAAAIPEAFLTAREALVNCGRVAARESVLIHAAAGGVGSAAVQLARALGAQVFATAGSPAKCDFVRALAADFVVDYRAADFADVIARETNGRGVDLILDFVGASYAEKHAACLAPLGRQVLIGLLGGARATVDFGRLMSKRQTLVGFTMRARSSAEKAELTRAFARTTLPLFDHGRLKPLVDSVFALSDVAQAHARMEANENLGKIVLRVR